MNDAAGASGGVVSGYVGINYVVAQRVLDDYRDQKEKLTVVLQDCDSNRNKATGEWQGEDAEMFKTLSDDIKKCLTTIESNISNLKEWLDNAKNAHKKIEQYNQARMGNAYSTGTSERS